MTRLRILLVLYVLLIFFVSSRSYLQSPGPNFAAKDKVAHVIEYAILGALLYWGIGFTASRSRFATLLFLVAVGAAIGALDEIFQGYIPGRATSMFDWMADVVGVTLGAGVFVLTATRRGPLSIGRGGDPA